MSDKTATLEILLDQLEKDVAEMHHITPAQMIRAIKRVRLSATTKQFMVVGSEAVDIPIQRDDPEVTNAYKFFDLLTDAANKLFQGGSDYDHVLVTMAAEIASQLGFSEAVAILAAAVTRHAELLVVPSSHMIDH